MFHCICGSFVFCDDDEKDRVRNFGSNVSWAAIESSWNGEDCNQLKGAPPICAGKPNVYNVH